MEHICHVKVSLGDLKILKKKKKGKEKTNSVAILNRIPQKYFMLYVFREKYKLRRERGGREVVEDDRSVTVNEAKRREGGRVRKKIIEYVYFPDKGGKAGMRGEKG